MWKPRIVEYKVQNSIEGQQYSFGGFLDFSKDFDTVNQKILLMKVEHYRLGELQMHGSDHISK